MNILLVEDDKRISDFLLKGLTEEGHQISLAKSGEEAREIISNHEFDIILLDIMLPGLDGMQLTQMIRFKKNFTPILVLSALNSPDDKIKMLDLGADDYLSKPFHFAELLSRIKALTRRNTRNLQGFSSEIVCGKLVINTDMHFVSYNDVEVELSPTEYRLLLLLMQNKNKVVGRTQILNHVWGIDFDNNTNILDVYISFIRNKLKTDGEKIIHTVKGKGYLIKD
ncbi:response regulator transcription factor [Chryseobacterium koreense]|uniref:Transcriptional regulator n=1 Tax=Chryseobacterium koreense CCUG 49689 TaxID=1304281 RepID=A0A0J7IWE6_9FLAO|nr:response regulator transcription factor [Chryseobacterium koreense]KMQ70623.1 transcriptional regulator [Chryseobacterium koreense CCUG 49689]MBB5334581.1 DNA-binding response OmpR family regulator [Chryseobacterium koreense]